MRNDSCIDAWHDRWMSTSKGYICSSPSSDDHLGLCVADFIDHEKGSWNWTLIDVFFPLDVRLAIASITLSDRWLTDRRFWWPNKSGKYSFKFGY